MNDPKRVLIVDDDPDFLLSMQAILESAGYQTLTACDGREGYDVTVSKKPDLVLLDVMMTERTEGFKVLKQIRSTTGVQNIPVILVSSLLTDLPSFKVMPEAGEAEADLFLPKPVDPGELLREVDRLLREGHVERTTRWSGPR